MTISISDLHASFFTCVDRDGVVVAELTRPQLSEEENLEQLSQEFLALVDQYQRRKIVVSLRNVTYLTSAALGKLILLHRKLHRKDGQLVICGVHGSVQDVLKTSKLDEYFTLTADVDSAVALLQMSAP